MMTSVFSPTQWQQGVWDRLASHPASDLEALQWLAGSVQRLIESYQKDNLVQTQGSLEDTLLYSLVALKQFEIDAGLALERAVTRLRSVGGVTTEARQPVMKIFEDRVEIWVQDLCRGAWNIFNEEELMTAYRLAQEFGCRVEDCTQGHEQLPLFGTVAPALDRLPGEAVAASVEDYLKDDEDDVL